MTKQEQEKHIVKFMITLYCTKKHNEQYLCGGCSELLEYAFLRAEKCPHKENKPFCSKCTIHCYKPEMKERIKKVMRFSGPRMLLHHPLLAIQHVLQRL